MIALSAFGADARAIVDVEAFGVVLHAPGERVQLVTRHRAGGAAHLLPRQRLPDLLSPSIAAVTIVTPLSSHAEVSVPSSRACWHTTSLFVADAAARRTGTVLDRQARRAAIADAECSASSGSSARRRRDSGARGA
jgi:hypothetical protein